MAVSLSLVNDAASLPIAWRLCLPQFWADGAALMAKVPDDVTFQTQIALDQIRTPDTHAIASGVILAEAGYGADGGFRAGLTGLDLIPAQLRTDTRPLAVSD